MVKLPSRSDTCVVKLAVFARASSYSGLFSTKERLFTFMSTSVLIISSDSVRKTPINNSFLNNNNVYSPYVVDYNIKVGQNN